MVSTAFPGSTACHPPPAPPSAHKLLISVSAWFHPLLQKASVHLEDVNLLPLQPTLRTPFISLEHLTSGAGLLLRLQIQKSQRRTPRAGNVNQRKSWEILLSQQTTIVTAVYYINYSQSYLVLFTYLAERGLSLLHVGFLSLQRAGATL